MLLSDSDSWALGIFYIFYKVLTTVGLPLMVALIITAYAQTRLSQKSPKKAKKYAPLFTVIWAVLVLTPVLYLLLLFLNGLQVIQLPRSLYTL